MTQSNQHIVKNSNLKDVKILIPDIPLCFSNPIRAGHRNIWNENSTDPNKPEISKTPPINGLHAEKIIDPVNNLNGWYWVCACNHCLENGRPYPYITCEEHDRCVTCRKHRSELTEIPMGHPQGFECKDCYREGLKAHAKQQLEKAKQQNHNLAACKDREHIICPHCATKYDDSEIIGYIADLDTKIETECEVCWQTFYVTQSFMGYMKYTTTKK